MLGSRQSTVLESGHDFIDLHNDPLPASNTNTNYSRVNKSCSPCLHIICYDVRRLPL